MLLQYQLRASEMYQIGICALVIVILSIIYIIVYSEVSAVVC